MEKTKRRFKAMKELKKIDRTLEQVLHANIEADSFPSSQVSNMKK